MNDVKKIAKELCEKSPCHHKCHDTKDCIVEDEALLLINQNKSNNFEVKSNNELFKQALVEGVNRRIDKTIEKENQIEQIGEMAKIIDKRCERGCPNPINCDVCIATLLYEAGYRKQKQEEKTYD